jgi:hypothetical protein
MRRNRADDTYFSSAEELRELRRQLGESVRLFVTRLDDTVLGAGIFLVHGEFVHAHLVGTADGHRALSPLKVMLDDVRSWAAARGAVRLHLGGGRGGRDDSLMAFKARFSPDRHPFSVGRWILDRGRYDELARRRFGSGGPPSDVEFFPVYRAPDPAATGADGATPAG